MYGEPPQRQSHVAALVGLRSWQNCVLCEGTQRLRRTEERVPVIPVTASEIQVELVQPACRVLPSTTGRTRR
jgi:hypothetical protein